VNKEEEGGGVSCQEGIVKKKLESKHERTEDG
jgi:hypothetical protein